MIERRQDYAMLVSGSERVGQVNGLAVLRVIQVSPISAASCFG